MKKNQNMEHKLWCHPTWLDRSQRWFVRWENSDSHQAEFKPMIHVGIKQCHKPFIWAWFVAPVRMLMTGGWFMIVLPCFTHISDLWSWYFMRILVARVPPKRSSLRRVHSRSSCESQHNSSSKSPIRGVSHANGYKWVITCHNYGYYPLPICKWLKFHPIY